MSKNGRYKAKQQQVEGTAKVGRNRSPAWEEARAKRRAKRAGKQLAPRNNEGFIVENDAGHQVLRDPGEKDRELYRRDSSHALSTDYGELRRS